MDWQKCTTAFTVTFSVASGEVGEAWALALVGAFGVGASCLAEASYLDGKSSLCAVVKDYCKRREGGEMRKCVSVIKRIGWLCNPY